jgi:hypothetical protein
MPPADKRMQKGPSGINGATANGMPDGKPSILNADVPLPQPSKLQRPQSAVVHSMNRRLTAPASSSDVRRSSQDALKIGSLEGENQRREVFGKLTSEALPHTSGASNSSSAQRNRPQSAMPSMNRGIASAADRGEIEDLKRDIIEVTRRINSNRQELQSKDLISSSSFPRVSSVDETESALRRFIPTNDPAQVQLAKNTLLCMLLQKNEELHRDTLSVLNLQHGASPSDAAASRLPSSGGSTSRPRCSIMLALADKTKTLSNDLCTMKNQTTSSATALIEAEQQIRKLTEERELLRATLTQASRSETLNSKP